MRLPPLPSRVLAPRWSVLAEARNPGAWITRLGEPSGRGAWQAGLLLSSHQQPLRSATSISINRYLHTTSPAASWPRIIGSLTTNGPIAPCVW